MSLRDRWAIKADEADCRTPCDQPRSCAGIRRADCTTAAPAKPMPRAVAEASRAGASQARPSRRPRGGPRGSAPTGHGMVDGRALLRRDRRRLRAGRHLDARREGLRLPRRRCRRDNGQGARPATSIARSTTATTASPWRPRTTRSRRSRRPIERIGQQIEAAQAASRRPRRSSPPTRPTPPAPRPIIGRQQQLAQSRFRRQSARAGAGRPRPGRRRRAGAQAALDRGPRQCRRAQGPAAGSASALAAELKTAVAKAERDLSSPSIRAPFDGVVGNRAVRGRRLRAAGQRLASLVPLDARLHRRQLQGNAARRAAARASRSRSRSTRFPTATIEGTVESVAPASGSVFSLLPPDNATGNFTKIVQRLPVRIRVPADVAARGPAAAGHVGRRQRRYQARAARIAALRPGHGAHGRQHRVAQRPRHGRHRSRSQPASARRAGAQPIASTAPARRLPGAWCSACSWRSWTSRSSPPRSTEIQAGLAASRRRDHLGADRLPDRRGGDDPALGLPVARARHAHAVRHLGRRLHRCEPDVRPVHLDQRDDRLARAAGLHRRRHDPDRVRHRLSRSSRARAWARSCRR